MALRVGAKRRRRIQEMLRSNQHSTTTDGRESQATPRVTVWKDGLIMMPLTKMEKGIGVFDVRNQAASLHQNVIFRSINLHQS